MGPTYSMHATICHLTGTPYDDDDDWHEDASASVCVCQLVPLQGGEVVYSLGPLPSSLLW